MIEKREDSECFTMCGDFSEFLSELESQGIRNVVKFLAVLPSPTFQLGGPEDILRAFIISEKL